MKEHLTVWLSLGLVSFSSLAQPSADAPAAADAPKIVVASADDEAYAGLVKGELEFSAQLNLLSSLAVEHRKRAEEATKANQGDKAQWENQLAKELADKSSVALKQLNELSKQRIGFEQTHKSAAVSVGSLNAATAASRPSPHEVEFLTKLDERLDKVDRDLLAARDYGNTYASQMHTNTTPYDIEKASSVLEDNAKRIRQLEQEQFDLELRRLEFQALRRH